jgi:hypothetical protein
LCCMASAVLLTKYIRASTILNDSSWRRAC